MKSRLIKLSGLFLALALVAAACGGETADTTTTTTAGEPEEVSITLIVGAVGQERDQAVKQVERFEAANPGITVELADRPDSATETIALYLQFLGGQSGDIDVYQIDVIWPGIVAEHAVDLAEYIPQADIDKHFPAIIENNTVDGKLVGIPWFTDAGLLYYRTDLLAKYNYTDPPTTWDELTEMAQTIQEGERADGNDSFWGFAWQGNSYEGLTCDAIEWQASSGGGTILDYETGEPEVNNAETIAALERAAGWVGTISPADVTTWQEEDARALWQTGNAAFMRNWPYAYSLGQADDSAIKDLFDAAALPSGGAGGAACLGGWQLMVSAYSEHPEEAAKLAAFLSSEAEQKIRAVEASFNPTIQTLYSDSDVLAAAPIFGSLFDVFVNATPRPSTVSGELYNEVSAAYFEAVHDVITGQADAAARMAELETELARIMR